MPEHKTNPNAGLSEELEDIRARLIASKSAAAAVADGLSDEQFNMPPGPDEWSVGECIEHLVVTGNRLLGPIDAAIEKAHRRGTYGRAPFRYGPLESWFARASSRIRPTGRNRVKTLAIYQPERGKSVSGVVSAYETLQDNLVERVEASDGLHLARIRITSPATRWVRLSLGQWLALIAGHQERHLDQARRARDGIVA